MPCTPELGDDGWRVSLKMMGVAESAFMANKATTEGFRRDFRASGDELWDISSRLTWGYTAMHSKTLTKIP
ncbi:MAG: hypothetical protein CBC10_005440 [Gammaproteobacteria bacterium TMED50]|nr:MAG: hypothetical protein CBC10_005440 [Gammaproteobacteria bacterium TMED50]